MTRYQLVRYTHGATERFHAQPSDGFASATEASLYAASLDLDGSWFIQPMDADPQPARMGGTL